MNVDYLISEDCKAELLSIYRDYFLEDEESFLHTINEFVKFYDKIPPERLMRTKYRQFLSRLLNKSKLLLDEKADYKAILINIPLYKHLHSILIECDADLDKIISFEDLFRNFNKFHKLYDILDELYDRDPQTSIRVKFVDFMNKVLKFYSQHKQSAYTEASLPRFEEYLKNKLQAEV
ncbi:MAG: hypothetical protein HWN65_09490 [Candidatus Helarchaeota archaeon]|nr:hypothetical protein [Candidatus Helarchaeota archaeon]